LVLEYHYADLAAGATIWRRRSKAAKAQFAASWEAFKAIGQDSASESA
jgi:hypothetical protein